MEEKQDPGVDEGLDMVQQERPKEVCRSREGGLCRNQSFAERRARWRFFKFRACLFRDKVHDDSKPLSLAGLSDTMLNARRWQRQFMGLSQ